MITATKLDNTLKTILTFIRIVNIVIYVGRTLLCEIQKEAALMVASFYAKCFPFTAILSFFE